MNNEEYICAICLDKFPKTNYHLIKGNKIEEAFSGRFPFVRIASYSYFVKEGILQALIHELKYNNVPDIGIFLGKISANSIKNSYFFKDINYILPVPLHPEREKTRGYNQSEKIAKGINEETKIPLILNNLVRITDNPSQTTKSKYERWENTLGIFKVRNPEILCGNHVLLVDDVLTTGSTIEACAKTILSNTKNCKISIFTVGSAI